MKLIYDNDVIEQLVEMNESTGVKKYYIRGKWSTMVEKNKNGRSYPEHLWVREVDKYQSVMMDGSINSLMEYKHPPRSSVEPMEAVAKITKLYTEGKFVMGEAVLLDNDKANQLKTLIDNGIKISVSSRGLGSVDKQGVVTDYKLITYDIVPDPSDYNATMNGMCESYKLNDGVVEGLEFDIDGNEISVEPIEEPKLSEAETKKYIVDNFRKLFGNFRK